MSKKKNRKAAQTKPDPARTQPRRASWSQYLGASQSEDVPVADATEAAIRDTLAAAYGVIERSSRYANDVVGMTLGDQSKNVPSGSAASWMMSGLETMALLANAANGSLERLLSFRQGPMPDFDSFPDMSQQSGAGEGSKKAGKHKQKNKKKNKDQKSNKKDNESVGGDSSPSEAGWGLSIALKAHGDVRVVLKPCAAKRPAELACNRLRNDDGESFAVQVEDDAVSPVLRIKVPRKQPAGRYRATVVDVHSDEAVAHLRVDVA